MDITKIGIKNGMAVNSEEISGKHKNEEIS